MHRSFSMALAAVLALPALAQTSSPVALQLQQVATGLNRITDISHCGDDRLFLTLQPGTIRILNGAGALVAAPFLDITGPVNNSGNEQGLLGLAFPPDYATTGFFYVHYTGGTGNGYSVIARYSVTADPNVADPASEEILYTWPQPYSNHNGGDLAFGADGYLYIGLGDGGSGGDPQNHAQNPTDPLGNMLRIDVSDPDTTYTIPPTNPFANVDAVVDTLPEIWASGLRNPFRFGFDRLTGDLWIGDVGQNAVEEVDFWPAGDNSHPNFGWRCYEANQAYNTAGCNPQNTYDAPVSFHPQASQGWCSVIGGRVYRGPSYWRIEGRYIYTDYCGGHFYSLYPNGSGGWTRTQLLASGQYGFSCIGENAAGELYAGNNETDILFKIKETCVDTIPAISLNGSVLTSTPATSYQWYLNGSSTWIATGQTHTAVVAGYYAVLATFTGGCQLASDTLWVSPVGMGELTDAQVLVSPVPANDVLRVTVDDARANDFALFDATGRMALLEARPSTGTASLAVASLPNGVYNLVVRDGHGAAIFTKPVVVQH
ncbi:MAG: PQQ-dependent sugar dehydrogenase [Flavobacteriales bacterium]|nr:PQQ-dependent sugar dehydrogenase [Flavobacteriales bacterium]